MAQKHAMEIMAEQVPHSKPKSASKWMTDRLSSKKGGQNHASIAKWVCPHTKDNQSILHMQTRSSTDMHLQKICR